MRLLVLGGTGFVGRVVSAEALARGWDVTVFNRGTRPPAPGAKGLVGDRLGDVSALRAGTWDLVVDTWKGAPAAVRTAARRLTDRTAHYAYISSCSVYEQPSPPGRTETARLVAGASPDATGDVPYPQAKLGGELAVAEVFEDRALIARAGLILGPHENVGRLPWWLARIARGGPILAPGPADLPLQYVDARDLAGFVLDRATTTGIFDVVSEPGHTTMGELLETCRDVTGGAGADLRWLTPEQILEAKVEPWADLPCWLPPGPLHDSLFGSDPAKALAAGLVCRPVRDTVAATWAWMRETGWTAPDVVFGRRVGLDPAREAEILAVPA